jgi:hypothetical protein
VRLDSRVHSDTVNGQELFAPQTAIVRLPLDVIYPIMPAVSLPVNTRFTPGLAAAREITRQISAIRKTTTDEGGKPMVREQGSNLQIDSSS